MFHADVMWAVMRAHGCANGAKRQLTPLALRCHAYPCPPPRGDDFQAQHINTSRNSVLVQRCGMASQARPVRGGVRGGGGGEQWRTCKHTVDRHNSVFAKVWVCSDWGYHNIVGRYAPALSK